MSAEPAIAIVDDDQSLRSALVHLLRALGYGVRGFASAEEFLQSGTLGDFACIVTDIRMPGMSGIELKRRLSDLQCQVPVIMITARTEPDLEDAAMASGAVCFLRKPFDVAELSQCLSKAISGQRGSSSGGAGTPA